MKVIKKEEEEGCMEGEEGRIETQENKERER